VSKNVAVFVDVANIFYAAKAAGIDIDYVTLLKSATAGRDFVRAYAYTGLDPENENQRQFHNFLARNGYKVISKDIRKYGDGRIKANLDIELVVDMMKTARNLDIAVVVSGDGDFAPAIRAVQEQGVRVEVISFRGNTSSDLIEVADQFTDIAQIARVDKSSGRSGRRVAAEGDLSMTEVPEKETEGAPRRRRGGRTRDERDLPEVAAVAAAVPASNLIALPGERLSRAPGAIDGNGVGGDDYEIAEGEVEAEGDETGVGALGESEDARRRRRRRGGRGRGRGRRADGETFEPVATGSGEPAADAEPEEEEDYEQLVVAPPPHQAFGSVWDSQIGVPSTPPSAGFSTFQPTAQAGPDDEDLDEPEVPEYLLAERRQRGGGGQRGGQRPTGGRMQRGNRAAYQVALDRERFGRGATPTPSGFGANSSSSTGGSRSDRPDRGPDRGRDRGRGRDRFQRDRSADRPPRSDAQPYGGERSSEPWSEVPPELEEMLRAELERKTGASGSRGGQPQASSAQRAPEPVSDDTYSATPDDAPPVPEQPTEQLPTKPVRRGRTSKTADAATATAEAPAETASTETAPTEEAPATKAKAATTRKRTTTTTTRSRTTKAATAAAAEAPSEEPAAEVEPAAKKPATRRRTTKASTEES
jgi:uncharacterized LabA/DUF88 family protein